MQRYYRVALCQASRVSRGAGREKSGLLVPPFSRVNASSFLISKSLRHHQIRGFSSATAVDVPVPSCGDLVMEVKVIEWLKNPGDAVAEDDVVALLETDLSTPLALRAPLGGRSRNSSLVSTRTSGWGCLSSGLLVSSRQWPRRTHCREAFQVLLLLLLRYGNRCIGWTDAMSRLRLIVYCVALCVLMVLSDLIVKAVYAAATLVGRVQGRFYVLGAHISSYTAILRAAYCKVDDDTAKDLLQDSLKVIEKSEKVTSQLDTPLVGRDEFAREFPRTMIEGEDAESPCSIRVTCTVSGPNGNARVLVDVTKGVPTDEYNRLVVLFAGRKEVVAIFGH